MKSTEFVSNLKDLLPEEKAKVNGGVAPLIPVAIAFGKGYLTGASIAGGVHLLLKAVDKASS